MAGSSGLRQSAEEEARSHLGPQARSKQKCLLCSGRTAEAEQKVLLKRMPPGQHAPLDRDGDWPGVVLPSPSRLPHPP